MSDVGQTRSHIDYFKQIRSRRVERYVIETNTLVIRLDKLISEAPDDPEKREEYEKHVVPWVADGDVKLCPSCTRTFNLSRRRHHCRLCGGIMCHNCSQFIDFEFAKKLTGPRNLEVSEVLSLTKSSAPVNRRGSTSSLLSVINSSGEAHIRVCKDCKHLLQKRDQQIEDHHSKPIMHQVYNRLKQYISEAEKLVPIYCEMCSSLSLGETNYNLQDGQQLRVKLMKLAESIDVVSKKISIMGRDDESISLSRLQLQLQNNIRRSATIFLRDCMLGLPSLPSELEFQTLQEERRIEIQKRIQLEKQLALEENSKQYASPGRSRKKNAIPKTRSYSPLAQSFEIVSPENGWGPESNTRPVVSTDPMMQQMDIIRNYIKQAREAHKYDEVRMLEDNLKELEIEYLIQKNCSLTSPMD